MFDAPRLSWLSARTRKQANGGRKGISGHNTEHSAALVENGSRTFAAEVEKAQTPAVSITEDVLLSIPTGDIPTEA